jgi:hypothetical protein
MKQCDTRAPVAHRISRDSGPLVVENPMCTGNTSGSSARAPATTAPSAPLPAFTT